MTETCEAAPPPSEIRAAFAAKAGKWKSGGVDAVLDENVQDESSAVKFPPPLTSKPPASEPVLLEKLTPVSRMDASDP